MRLRGLLATIVVWGAASMLAHAGALEPQTGPAIETSPYQQVPLQIALPPSSPLQVLRAGSEEVTQPLNQPAPAVPAVAQQAEQAPTSQPSTSQQSGETTPPKEAPKPSTAAPALPEPSTPSAPSTFAWPVVPAPNAPSSTQVTPSATENDPPVEKPHRVPFGAFISDIQEVEFRTHSYVVDLYVWVRWKDPNLAPFRSLEFMNRFAPHDHVRDTLYEAPKRMPDGTFYNAVRVQGRFSTKFNIDRYPFDTQALTVIFEDAEHARADLIYVPDTTPMTLNPDIKLPGFKFGTPRLRVTDKPYPTDFGDLSEPGKPAYSRVILELPISRPIAAQIAMTFVPILLVLFCSGLVFFIRPGAVDGRIGLGITALLTLVALQLTNTASLPDVDYLMMLHKIYFLSYLFIVAGLVRVVATSWVEAGSAEEYQVAWMDRQWAFVLVGCYVAATLAIGYSTLVE